MNQQKVWFVTGASKGLGLALVQKLLTQGYKVAATSRTLDSLKTAVGTDNSNFLPLALDLLNETDVQRAIHLTIDHFGSLDVVVNNAGYGLVGALEELSDVEARANFDVNVFGALNIIRQALPQLRRQRSGHIFNIASIGGFNGGFPGFGIYCATKFAVHGFSEGLLHEAAPFGIHTTLVMPGYFRTNFLEGSSLLTPKQELPEYQNVRDVQLQHQQQINNNQPGDPDKAADVLIAVAGMNTPPFHLFLGSDAVSLAEQKMTAVQQEVSDNRPLMTSTNFEMAEA
ncbi:NADP-dependent 3-hydroxy acid dehydrogenase YdfG [Cnuella takakiae]|uniref:NADP-dependent 3-hydroxy acid dehydrogenase YdfG n=1 Tax=Cnuella takakiae TaxID=1302690 RepID=A0A1M4ZJD5_9BACT|nr:SDR family oxidoreductase [Cnuella takakiae]OLY94191.1 short-chain dehydrogenase/reductase [Cnuella takakiae]SHF18134.1 NADP-dependent 3-hydroxy acid dehydrogenase YdfG [Cnuella takakiae]